MATRTKAERIDNGTVRVQVVVDKETWKRIQHAAIDQEVTPFVLAGNIIADSFKARRNS
jgi:hypothetical protein